MKRIKIGDKVLWRGGFDNQPTRPAIVVGIDLCSAPHVKYGKAVKSVSIEAKDKCVFTLDNNHWAYGDQIEFIEKKIELATFEVTSGKIMMSDPCYENPTWCQGIVDVKNGTWNGIPIYYDGRVAMLIAVHKDCNRATFKKLLRLKAAEIPCECGVDSGQFGFFDLGFYRDDKAIGNVKPHDFGNTRFLGNADDEGKGEVWYRACCELTLNDESFGVLPNGCVSSSGWGDGGYTAYGIKEGDVYVALVVEFIPIVGVVHMLPDNNGKLKYYVFGKEIGCEDDEAEE